MNRTRGGQRGFTLVELMIVVAIIGILAAIAIPNFLTFRLKSKTAEAKSSLGGIRSAEIAYYAEFNSYVGGQPLTPTSRTEGNAAEKIAWIATTRFSQLGYAPEGKVYFSYSLLGPDFGSSLAGFTATAVGDLDGDTHLSRFMISNASTEITHTGDLF